MSNNRFQKELIRGSLKELMRTRGIRSISFANYDRWANNSDIKDVHTMNVNLENGYVRFYAYNENPNIKTRGKIIEDVSLKTYQNTYKRAKTILEHEEEIPSKIRRNILVPLYR